MSIVLTHGYFLEEDEVEKKIMKPYPTLGILYISSYLKERGVDHSVIDTTFSTTEKWQAQILEIKPAIIGFYVNLMTKVKVIKLIKFLRENPVTEKIKIILGGPDITYNQDNYLEAGADFLVIGEGEETFFELVWTLQERKNWHLISGIAYAENGKTKSNPPRQKVKDLDTLPFPNRAVFPIDQYLATWKEAHGKSALNISTQRGCPYTCKWCSTAVYGQSYRRRSPENVVAELKELKETYNPDSFWFVDDVFTVSHKWIRGFAEAIKTAGLSIQYECITRAERMNEEIIELLKNTGCFRVWIGAESGSQKVINAMDRRVDINLVRDQLIATRKAGMEAGTFIMVGYPGEEYEDILKTARYLEEAMPDQFTITKSYPIKGTALYTEIEDKITKRPNWFSSTDREIDFKRKYSDRFYAMAIRYIHNRVKLKRYRLAKKKHLPTLFKVITASTLLKLLAKN